MITEPGARPEAWLYEALSAARLRPYLAGADGDPDAAWALYQWNLDVCAAFYAPLHWCEVALRNAMHDVLRAHYRTDHWWDAAPLDANGRAMVAKARSGQAERKGRPAASDDVVARLTLGFWVSLVSRGHSYDREFWHKSLHAAFPHYSGKRRDLHRELNAIRGFRNRIMHHEPIFNRDLTEHRERVYRVLGYLSAALHAETSKLDRIQAELDRAPL